VVCDIFRFVINFVSIFSASLTQDLILEAEKTYLAELRNKTSNGKKICIIAIFHCALILIYANVFSYQAIYYISTPSRVPCLTINGSRRLCIVTGGPCRQRS